MEPSGLPPDVAGTVVTVGTFDGVHLGHREIVTRLAASAAASGLRSLLVTFQPHPLEIVNPSAAPMLLTPGTEKLDALAESGLDFVAVLPFTERLAALEAEQFVDQVLRDRFRMRALLIGHDHGFGRGRSGDEALLRRLGSRRGFAVDIVPPVVMADGAPLSSSLVRRAVGEGDLATVRDALGRRYGVSGRVVRGDQRGRLLGYPTLNVRPESGRKLLPADGVYAVRVQTPSGEYDGMANVGPRPTVGDDARSLEAHLFDASGDWYGTHVRVDFVARLRPVQRFASISDLTAQLARDEADARRALGFPVPNRPR